MAFQLTYGLNLYKKTLLMSFPFCRLFKFCKILTDNCVDIRSLICVSVSSKISGKNWSWYLGGPGPLPFWSWYLSGPGPYPLDLVRD